jgi:hypothetical protein
MWAIPPGAGSSWRWRGRGGERERTGSTTFLPVLSRLSFVDWVTGGERQMGGEINRGFLGASKAPSGYSTFGLRWLWYERDLGAVVPTGLKESSLAAPSSSADVRVCKQNRVWFWGPKYCLEFGWVTRLLAGGRCSGTLWGRFGFSTGGVQGLIPVCMCVCFLCRVVMMVYFVTILSWLAACSDVVTLCNARVECVCITFSFCCLHYFMYLELLFFCVVDIYRAKIFTTAVMDSYS